MEDDQYISLKNVPEEKIAEAVVNELLKGSKREHISLSVEEVQANLIKPIHESGGDNIP